MGGWTSKDMPSMAHKVVIVTGANTGIGFHTALELGRAGAELVVLACRDATRAEAALTKMQEQCPTGHFEVMLLDLSNLASVRAFCEQFVSRKLHLDLLVCNAGVLGPPTLQITADGFELQQATNHLGHFALVGGLLPALLSPSSEAPESANSMQFPRVVVVSSIAAQSGDVSDLRQLTSATPLGVPTSSEPHAPETATFVCASKKKYDVWALYSRSKLENLLFVRELARRYEGRLMVVGAHPGVTHTEVLRNQKAPIPRCLMSATEKGALPTLRAATCEKGMQSGTTYFGPLWGMWGRPAGAWFPRQAKDKALAEALWTASVRATGVTY